MKKFVLICFCVLSSVGGYAQNWDINTLHKINSLDSKFARNYSKAFSKSAPYIAVGVPVAMAVYAGIDKDKELLKDAIYIGTSVAEAVVITYGMKYAFDRERPYDRYPDRVDARSHESSPSFPSGHTAAAFSLATSLSIRYPKWYVIAPSAFWACSVGFSRMNEGVHYYERQIKDVVRQDYWTRIFPIFFMNEQELRMIVRNDLIYHDQTWNHWKVIEGYCSSCGKITEYRTFQTEKDALCYAAGKQVFDMAPISTICNQCYYTQYIDCA